MALIHATGGRGIGQLPGAAQQRDVFVVKLFIGRDKRGQPKNQIACAHEVED
jgi:hypothetical protein